MWRGGVCAVLLCALSVHSSVHSQSGTAQNASAAPAAAAPKVSSGEPRGGKAIDVYAHYNSLHNHANPNSKQGPNTRVGNWVARLAAQAPGGGNAYTLGAKFGFFHQWTLPPVGSTAHEEVKSRHVNPYTPSWSGAKNVEVVEFVPDNFDGHSFDPAQNTNMRAAYLPVLLSLIDGWEANAPNPNRRYVIYAGWPTLNGYGGRDDDPSTISASGYAKWVAFGLGPYQDWMKLMVARLKAARPGLDIRLHDINRVLLMTYQNTVVREIPPRTLFEDLAPHGRSTWYFLAALAEYMELFGEKPPADFVLEQRWDVDPRVKDNYRSIVEYMWSVL